MNQKNTLTAGVILAGTAVALGAFGAHALKELLEKLGRTETFELAVRYQFYHALALLAVGLMRQSTPSKKLGIAAVLFIFGILFFSGSLYVLSLSGQRILGAITPIGGVLFMAGWAMMLLAIWEREK